MPLHPEKSPSDWQLRPLAAALIAAGILVAPGGADAATLTVATLAETSVSACTLRDAVHSLNAQADQGACTADLGGGGYGSDDAIVFAQALSGTITFATSDPLAVAGPSALSIQRPVSLVGPGSGLMLLTCGSTTYRLLEIASTPPVAVSGLTIAGCVSAGDGAGMLVTDRIIGNVSPIVQLTDVVVRNNSMVNPAAIGGGVAVTALNVGATVSITDSSIFANASSGNGGGIGIRGGIAPAMVAVTDSTLNQNKGRAGGGVAVQTGASIQLTRSTLAGNVATADGGGILVQGAAATVRDTTVSGNQAAGRGGGVALALAPSAFTAINSTLSTNRASGVGGGISARSTGPGAITLRSATLAVNVAARGAGIMVENAIPSTLLTPANVVAINTIVAGNGGGPGVFDIDSLQPDSWDVSFSVIGNVAPSMTLTGAGNITGAAVPPPFGGGGWLGPLQDNGGPTLTHELLTSVTDPAINAGNSGFSGLSFDQRGKPFTRVREGRIDIGAFESGPLPVTVPVPAPVGWTLAGLSALLGLAGLFRRRKR